MLQPFRKKIFEHIVRKGGNAGNHHALYCCCIMSHPPCFVDTYFCKCYQTQESFISTGRRDLSFSQTTNFGLFQTERVCRLHNFRFDRNMAESSPDRSKICGKRRNCSLRAISPFPTVFSKDLYCTQVKSRACLGKG